jgi:hypothetical protein
VPILLSFLLLTSCSYQVLLSAPNGQLAIECELPKLYEIDSSIPNDRVELIKQEVEYWNQA